MPPTLEGGTQDTDFNKGFTKGNFTTNLRRRNGGGQGDPDTLIINLELAFRFSQSLYFDAFRLIWTS